MSHLGSDNGLVPAGPKPLSEPMMDYFSDAYMRQYPDSKVHAANMGPIWGRQDPGGPHVGPMTLAIWVYALIN